MDSQWKEPHTLTAERAEHILGYIKHSTTRWVKEVMVLLCSALVWPHHKDHLPFWAPQFEKDVERFLKVSSRATKWVKELEGTVRAAELSGLV